MINNEMLVGFLNDYNQCFYDKDINKLRQFYDTERDILIYFDNHKGNDTYTVEEHFKLLFDFFKNGKDTETGEVEPLIIENLQAFEHSDSACLCFISRYKSFPDPGVRSSLYLEKIQGTWKIIHAHFSFEPDM